MYQLSDIDSSVTLGIPSKKAQQFRSEGLEGWEKATISKIGGYPVWHDQSTAPHTIAQLPLCKVCNSNDNVVLVAQIFAPTEVDRSLYVFCCNKRACSLQHNGWIVLRNQQLSSSSPAESKVEAVPSAVTPSTPTIWNVIADNEDDDDDDLLDLLKARDKSLLTKAKPDIQPPPQSAPIAPVNAIVESSKSFLITSTALPISPIEEIDEGWESRYDDDETENYTQKVDSLHINKMIESYLHDEDDEETLLALKASGLSIHREISSSTSKGLSRVRDDDEDESVQDGDDEVAKRMRKDGTKENVEQYFQKRVSLEPKQVLRYAYEGEPLWISIPTPLDSSKKGANKENAKARAKLIPHCEKCGSKRVFECQLMPALLSYIIPVESVEKEDSISSSASASATAIVPSTTSNNTTPPPSLSLADALGDGIDFGVVTIWTCPNSCYVSNASQYSTVFTEIAIVQQPPDFL